MRESRSSGSVEGVVGNHDSYSDLKRLLVVRSTSGCRPEAAVQAARQTLFEAETPFESATQTND
jgi:hypothetical protein